MSRLRSPRAWAVGAAVLLAAGVYANTLANGFAYDDAGVIVDNPGVQSLANLPRFFTEPYWPENYGGSRTSLYRPVVLLTIAIDWAIWDGRAFGFHLMNMLWHALATALLTCVLLRLATPLAAGLGGALFAVHPVHVEAVANVVGRAEPIAAIAIFAALLWATRRDADRPTTAVAVAALYLLAIWTKESAIVFPALLALVDGVRGLWAPTADPRPYLRRRFRTYTALAVAAVGALAARAIAIGTPLGHDTAAAFLPDDTFATRLFTMTRVWPNYIRLLIAPFDLSPDYSPAVILPADAPTLLGALGLVVVILLFLLAAAAWPRAPLVSAGILWPAITLLPVSNLLFTSGVVLAERTLYLPSAGLSLAAAGVVPLVAGASRARRAVAAVAAGLFLIALSARTIAQNPRWADTLTLFRSALREHPESYKVHWALGYNLAVRGDLADAFAHYRDAVRFWPHDHRLWAEIAAQYLRVEAWRPAEDAAQRARALDSTYVSAHHFLVLSLSKQNRWEDAARAAVAGLEDAGPDPLLFFLLSRAHESLGDPRSAAAALRQHLALQEANWAAWIHVARLHTQAGDTVAALAALDSARVRLGEDPRAAEAVEAFHRRLRTEP